MLRFRLIGAVLLIALFGAGLYGQGEDKKGDKKGDKKPDEKPPPVLPVRGTLPQYYKKLGLRDDQKQSIYKIRATHKAKVEELKRQLQELKDREKEALEKVLTPEQLKRLRQLRSGEKVSG
jgi:hypothetical protein